MVCNNEDQSLTEKAIQRLRARNGRLTAPRRLVLSVLETFPAHPTAEQVYERVRQAAPQVNLSTVYRTLRWLQKEGLVSARSFPDGERQDRFDPNLPEEHFHFLCRECKAVIEFDSPVCMDEIVARFEGEAEVKVERVGLAFYGLCAACRERERSGRDANRRGEHAAA